RVRGSSGRCWHNSASGCGRRMRLESPQKLGGPFFVHDHGHKVLAIPNGPKATVWVTIHAKHGWSPPQVRAEDARPPHGCTVLGLAGALFAGHPVAVSGALRIPALFHGALVQRAPVCRARRWRGRGSRAVTGRRTVAGGLLCRQGLLHGLLDQGVYVGGW